MSAVELLLVEDNPGDVRLTQEALRESPVRTHLSVVHDGVEALAFLRRQGTYSNAPRPNLVLLDLQLPKKGGLEVLAEMKTDPHLRRIPVVVLSSSDEESDVLGAYDGQASCFVTKPADLEQFVQVVRRVHDFCLTVVKLPPATAPLGESS
jgi:CheY-like chemotaxis protein